MSGVQASSFYDEVLTHGEVWTVKDGAGFPAPENHSGARAMPFWSLRTRAETVIATVAAYTDFEPVAIPLGEWRSRWLVGLERDGLLIGLNWSGDTATGYDLPADDVERALSDREHPDD